MSDERSGASSIPWFYASELFASNARASATAVACAVNWGMNFAVGLLFPPIQEVPETGLKKIPNFLIFTPMTYALA
uniref:MFS domain-containing protein n=1 Tax=Ascaris lumbricoides TaxID=6252 RepID=A0A0M3HN39_ASCLU